MLEKVQIVILKELDDTLFALLLQTNKSRGGFWQNITGSVESDDLNTKNAAIREVLEETGLFLLKDQVYDLNSSFTYENINKNLIFKEYVYYAIIDDSSNIKISNEHDSFKWKPTTLITELDSAPRELKQSQ